MKHKNIKLSSQKKDSYGNVNSKHKIFKTQQRKIEGEYR